MTVIDAAALVQARDRLLNGDVVAIPTETVYGLAASIASEAGLRRVFALKQRPFFDPLIVHVASFEQAKTVVREWPPLADYLARVFWPGPLTLVLPKAETVNPLITSGLETVAVRHPRHEATEELIELLGTPIAAPSANRFGRTSPSRADHVAQEFPGEDLLILDGGPCEVGLESTVIAFGLAPAGERSRPADEIRILRPGGVTEDDLREALQKWAGSVDIVRPKANQQSPGHLEHHYMPAVPLAIVGPQGLEKAELDVALNATLTSPAELLLSDEPEQAARELYAQMRAVAASGADAIFVRRTPERSGGFWDAIWDRLQRAATVDLSK